MVNHKRAYHFHISEINSSTENNVSENDVLMDKLNKKTKKKNDLDEKPDVEVETAEDNDNEDASGSGNIEFGSGDLSEDDEDDTVSE